MAREVKRWVTVNGHHVPIYAEEDNKLSDIKNSDGTYKENAEKLNGGPGKYILFRSGNLDAPNGMIFLATQAKEAEYYGAAGKDMDIYQLDIKNPLYVDGGDSDGAALATAWKKLHPDKELKFGKNGLTGDKWQQLDKQNSTALIKSEYDAIIYKVRGKVAEVQIPGKQRDRLIKRDTVEHPGTTTMKTFLPKAREAVSGFNGSESELGRLLEKSLSNSNYKVEYKDWLSSVIVTPKEGTELEKSRGQIFLKWLRTSNGRYFIRATGGEEPL